MKKYSILLILAVFAINVSLAQTVKKGRTKIYYVKSDQMLTTNNSSGSFTDCLWVETDETQGKIILNFEGIYHPSPLKAAYLIINIPNVQDAGSTEGMFVTKDDKQIGSIKEAKGDTFIYVPLDITALNSQNIKLTLNGGGPDGLAISSKSSGFGPYLQFEY